MTLRGKSLPRVDGYDKTNMIIHSSSVARTSVDLAGLPPQAINPLDADKSLLVGVKGTQQARDALKKMAMATFG